MTPERPRLGRRGPRSYDALGRWLARLSRGATVRDVGDGAVVVQPTRIVPPGMYAWTVGHTILARGPLSERLLRHESCHVRQFERYGWTFPFRYYWASLVTLSYRRNRFEVEARAAEDDVP